MDLLGLAPEPPLPGIGQMEEIDRWNNGWMIVFVFLLPDNDDTEAWRWLHNNKMGQLLVQNPQSGTRLNEK